MRRWLAAAFSLMPFAAMAGNGLNLDSLTGEYRVRDEFYDHSDVGESTLKIVKVSSHQAYFWTNSSSRLGVCELDGVAQIKPSDLGPGTMILEYRAKTPNPRNEVFNGCVFDLDITQDKILLADRSNCREYTCGFRVGYGDLFDRRKRHPIRNMAKLKASPEYIAALNEARLPH